jgi:hypothetical protein
MIVSSVAFVRKMRLPVSGFLIELVVFQIDLPIVGGAGGFVGARFLNRGPTVRDLDQFIGSRTPEVEMHFHEIRPLMSSGLRSFASFKVRPSVIDSCAVFPSECSTLECNALAVLISSWMDRWCGS